MTAEQGQGARQSWIGWIGVLALLLLALHAGRATFVAAEGERRPELARAIWPSHPLPRVTMALADIGAAAREGRAPPGEALAQMRFAGRVDPLGVQPLLVSATEQLAAGQRDTGERLLKAALRRDPRSTAAHFLLADLYVREQRVGDALVHVAVLGRRLRGGGTDPFATALATYLRDTGRIAEVKPMLETNALLRTSVMTALAQDAASGAALRGLTRRGDAAEEWFPLAFERELAAGRVAEARRLLAAAGISGGGTALARWSAGAAAGPLSWRLPATSEGVAEPVRGGPLRLVYYGRADTILVEHLLLLPPGRYRLLSQFAGPVPASTFEWRMACLAGNRQLAAWPVTAATGMQLLDVPSDCAAQRLALWGRTGEFPRTTAIDLVRISLDRAGVQQ